MILLTPKKHNGFWMVASFIYIIKEEKADKWISPKE
jgi:hypothetical protein